MKKVISVILSVIVVALSVTQGFCAFAQETEQRKLYNFASQLSAMVRENDKNSFEENSKDFEDIIVSADKFYGNSVSVEFNTGLPDDAFETQRLIVKSEKSIDYQGAIDCVSGYNNLYILQYDTVFAAKSAYQYYLTCDYIEYVEPDVIMSAQDDFEIPGLDITEEDISDMNDVTSEAIEWLSDKIGFTDIEENLKDKIADDYILVAVLDSGVDTDHEYFEGRLEASNYNSSSTGEPDSAEDDYGHGTHVTGIIVGNTLSNVKIKPYKVLNNMGNGSLSTISTAVDMAVQDGADIINMSLSSKSESQRMTEAVNNAVAHDVNVVVAAGNAHIDLDKTYVCPASIDSAITVSATDKYDKLASFSNYDGTIDIAAPGENIKSCYLNNTYTSMSGTSMAAPQVTSGLAIIQTIYQDKPASECEEMIKDFAVAMSENAGENHFGAGLLYLKYLLDGKPTTAEPVFSVDSCTFTDSFNVSISCPEKDATIYYIIYDTGDWDNINLSSGLEYTKPITVSIDTKIAAIAVGKGKAPSSIVTVEYDRLSEAEENDYDINMLGYITGYYGTKEELVVPEIIKGKTVKGVASGAFENNEYVKVVVLPDTAEIINLNAFRNCKKLESVSGESVTTLSIRSFSECKNLISVNFPNLTLIGEYAFADSSIKSVDMQNVTDMGTNVFNGCSNLETVSLPAIEVVSIGTFRNCVSLTNVDLSSATKISANAFRNSGLETIKFDNVEEIGNYAFADCPKLKGVNFPKVTSTGAYAFQNDKSLIAVLLPSLEELNSSVFQSCSSLKTLHLTSVKNIVKNAFSGSSIEHLRLDSVETIKSLPSNLNTLMVSSTLEEISVSAPATDLIVYGYEGTYAEKFAKDNNKELCSVPTIVYDLPEQVDAEKSYIMSYAIGFNCKYQWYKIDETSEKKEILIEGATKFYYQPSRDDNASGYYCVITSDDGINVATATTKTISNAPEYMNADYSEYNALYEEYKKLDRQLYKDGALDSIDELFKLDVTQYSMAEQNLLNEYIDKIKKAIESAEFKFVLCDINNDGKISIIDARLALKAVVGSYKLDNTQKLAADVNGDGKVSIADSRAILKSVLDK